MSIRETLAILFYLRRDKSKNSHEVPIYLRITVNGQRAEMATKRIIDPKKWNNEGGFAKGTKEEIKSLNEYLDILRSKVYAAQRELLEENCSVNKVIWDGRTSNGVDLPSGVYYYQFKYNDINVVKPIHKIQ